LADLRHRPARGEHHLRDRRHQPQEALVGEGLLKHLRPLGSTALLLLAAPVLAGCGGGSPAAPANASTAHPTGGYLAATDLERQLGSAFRHGLYRLAVMSQKSEDALDLGQPLPTGLLREVHCESAAPRPSGGAAWPWICDVRWKTVEGRAQRTRYSVRLTRGDCFAAGAAPRRQPRYDATIRTYGEDPLNALGTLRRGC
jgi:hypothetical protein